MKSSLQLRGIVRVFFSFLIYSLAIHLQAETPPHTDVRIISKNTKKNDKHYGSGFMWPDDNHVVTAFHVVAGSDSIRVEYSVGDKIRIRNAQIERVLLEADLALLRFDEPLRHKDILKITESFSAGQQLLVKG